MMEDTETTRFKRDVVVRVLFQKQKHIEGPTLPRLGKVGQFYYNIICII